MDAGIAARSVTSVAVSDYVRPASTPIQQAVATELDSAQTVSALTDSTELGSDATSGRGRSSAQSGTSSLLNGNGRDASLSRQYVIDPQTQDVLFRVMDTRTRQVIRQVPDEALRRIRAYAKALSEGQNLNRIDFQTSIEA